MWLSSARACDGTDALPDLVSLVGWTALLARSSASKDAGLLALRQELASFIGRIRSRGRTGVTAWYLPPWRWTYTPMGGRPSIDARIVLPIEHYCAQIPPQGVPK